MANKEDKLKNADTESKYAEVADEEEYIKITPYSFNIPKPTYDDLKTEIIAFGISSKKYQRTYRKAKTFYRSFAMPKYKTPSDGTLDNKLFGINIFWEKGQRMTIEELLVLMLVIDYDIIKSKLHKCTEEQLKNCFHLRRQLFIVVNKYGSNNFGKHDKLYFPATQQISTTGPLLMTSSMLISDICVSGKGITVEVIPESNCWKAFDASKLSDYQKQLWLIDFVYLPIAQVNISQCQVLDNQSPIPICKI